MGYVCVCVCGRRTLGGQERNVDILDIGGVGSELAHVWTSL